MGTDFDNEEAHPFSIEPVRLIAIDLDGTLLRDDLSICMASAQAIAEAEERGIKVVIATGRSPRETVRFYQALDLTTPALCHNGALLLNDPAHPEAEPIHHQPLPGELARQVVEIAHRVGPSLAVGLEIIDKVYTRKDGLYERPELYDSSVTKVAMAGDPTALADAQMAIGEHFSDAVAFAPSSMRLIMVTHPEANKAAGLQRLAKMLGVERESVMAIGDAPNDTPMLDWAGVGIAMANGWDCAKQAAHFTVASNEEAGVAHAIEQYALK